LYPRIYFPTFCKFVQEKGVKVKAECQISQVDFEKTIVDCDDILTMRAFRKSLTTKLYRPN